MVYNVVCSLNLSKSIDEVGELVDRVNTHLSSMGMSEQIEIGSEFTCLTLTVDRPFTEEEQKKAEDIMREKLEPLFANSGLKVDSISLRKSTDKSSSKSLT